MQKIIQVDVNEVQIGDTFRLARAASVDPHLDHCGVDLGVFEVLAIQNFPLPGEPGKPTKLELGSAPEVDSNSQRVLIGNNGWLKFEEGEWHFGDELVGFCAVRIVEVL